MAFHVSLPILGPTVTATFFLSLRCHLDITQSLSHECANMKRISERRAQTHRLFACVTYPNYGSYDQLPPRVMLGFHRAAEQRNI